MHGRRGIANQVYIPPVDYDNNIKELKSPRRQLPRQYSDPPPYHENGTNGSVDSNYMQQQGANIFEMQSQSNGTITSTNSSYCSYDSLKNEEGSYSYIPFPENEARRVLKPDTRKVTHRYVIIVAIVLVALAILAAIAATALKITGIRPFDSIRPLIVSSMFIALLFTPQRS
ncbi:uncharacterized protein [Argopecten irradians]|uniref:uncharacterized protein n=1 Tax=Argopecten irradians TaxID=31199 RepID=UPI00371A1FC6